MTEGNTDKPTRRKKEQTNAVLVVVCLCVAVIAGIVCGVQSCQRRHAETELEELAGNTWRTADSGSVENTGAAARDSVQPASDPIEALREMGVPIPDKEVDFAALQEETNPDIYAWIYIPDTQIDYPVLQHPTDDTYYLNYNIDGSKGYPGCIYTEKCSARDFTDPNTVLYGHNMKNGSMFAGLHKFEDSEYFAEHPYVYIYTEDGLLVYAVFAAYESGDEHILNTYDFTKESVYEKYLEDLYSTRSMNRNIREDVEVTTKDRILTLSTCIADKPNNRYLVQGVLLNED